MERELRICQQCAKEFAIETDDFSFYKKIGLISTPVPEQSSVQGNPEPNLPKQNSGSWAPTFCPECRMIRRFMWRNERFLFRRTENREEKQIFCGFHKEVPAIIYDLEFWNSDGWDPMSYGKDCDFSRPFFEQYKEFLYSVPWPAKSVQRMVNSDYCDQAGDMKNAYLCFSGSAVENSAYVVWGEAVKDSFDLYQARHTELSYDSYMVDDCSRVFFSINCEESTDIWFSKNLVGCMNCFGSVNLRNKQYYIFNEPYSKEAYKEYMAKLDFGSRQTIEEFKKKAHAFWLTQPMKYALAIQCVNSTGEHIERSKNLTWCYSVHEGQNLAYSQFMTPPVSDSYDYTVWGQDSSQMYEVVTSGEQCDSVKFSWECWPGCRNVEYSAFCRSSSDLFACVGLKKKQYCIFNKQYSKEEYSALRDKIIAHMNAFPYMPPVTGNLPPVTYRYGEFFPPEFSPYAYNESIAQDYFTLKESETLSKGFLWRNAEAKEYQTTMDARNLPDTIDHAPNEILKEIIKCEKCHKAYRIIEMELQFYRHIRLPIPHLCPNCRFNERFAFVNPPKFWHGKCQCGGQTNNLQPTTNNKKAEYKNATAHAHGDAPCPNEFETSYSPEQPDIIYCEQCYQAEVA